MYSDKLQLHALTVFSCFALALSRAHPTMSCIALVFRFVYIRDIIGIMVLFPKLFSNCPHTSLSVILHIYTCTYSPAVKKCVETVA